MNIKLFTIAEINYGFILQFSSCNCVSFRIVFHKVVFEIGLGAFCKDK